MWKRAWPALPALVLIFVVFAIPVGSLLWQGIAAPEIGIQNITRVLGDPTNLTVIGRTVGMSIVVTLVCAVMAYPYAYLMTQASGGRLALLVGVLLMPFWTSLLARTFAWVVLLQAGGPVQSFLQTIGVAAEPLLGSTVGVTIGMTQIMLPFFTLPLYASMRGIDGRLMKAAVSLGASFFTAFRTVLLPLSVPGLVGGASAVFVLTLGFYVTPALLGSPRESMISQIMAVRIDRLLDFPGVGVLAGAMLVLAIVGVALIRLLGATVRSDRSTQS